MGRLLGSKVVPPGGPVLVPLFCQYAEALQGIMRSMQSRRSRRLQKRASADLYVVHSTVQVQQTKHKNRKPSKIKNTNHKKNNKQKQTKKQHNHKPGQLDSEVLLMN